MANKKKQVWVRTRHKWVQAILKPVLGLYTRWRYHIDVKKFPEGEGRQYLIMMNHQTAFDQFFVAMAFPQAIYYVASEDLFSKGFISRAIEWLVAPIPFKKSTSDLRAVKNCIRVVKEGGSIAIAPEGNRTYSGVTEHIKPSIASLARTLKLPIAFFRIEGGFGIHPRWSDVVRKGHMTAGVSRVLEPEEYLAMTEEELFRVIEEELYVDDCTLGGTYHHGKAAEYMERAFYVCPHCGLARFESSGNTVKCLSCGMSARYLPDLTFESLGGNFPFRTAKDWYNYQSDFIRSRTDEDLGDGVLYEDTAKFSEVIIYKDKIILAKDAQLRLFRDRVECRCGETELVLPFDEVKVMSVLGRNKLNIYFGEKLYQCKGDARFNAVKYTNLFYRYNNLQKGEVNGEFLGL